MNLEDYYGDALPRLRAAERCMIDLIASYPVRETLDGINPILYTRSRIKEPESMMRKLKLHGLPADSETALDHMHDAVGVRVICSFMDNVYEVSKWLHDRGEFQIIAEKDYISCPKPNGYRSLHLIVQFAGGITDGIKAEIQLRTIAIDFWAALEHQIKYKRNIEHEKTIRQELKCCADEIASVDVSMQTLRDILRDSIWE